jgi:hypothetical protein
VEDSWDEVLEEDGRGAVDLPGVVDEGVEEGVDDEGVEDGVVLVGVTDDGVEMGVGVPAYKLALNLLDELAFLSRGGSDLLVVVE